MMQAYVADHRPRYMQDIFADLRGVGDIDCLIAGEILRQNSSSLQWPVEDHGKAAEVSEDAKGTRRVGHRQCYIALRHVPGLADACSLLRSNGDGSVRKAGCEDKRLVALCVHLGERHVPGDPRRRALIHSLSHKILLPGLRSLKMPAID